MLAKSTPDTAALCKALLLSAFLFCLSLTHAATKELSQAELLTQVGSGKAFAMMRHALAPGTGDPSDFVVNDCATQRNLSDKGREQAENIGAEFIKAGIADAKVMTSEWCRCRETATLLGIGTPETLTPLNSFFQNRANGANQTTELRNWLIRQENAKPVVLVTHQVNITALTGVYPASGETVVFRFGDDQAIEVLGTFLASKP